MSDEESEEDRWVTAGVAAADAGVLAEVIESRGRRRRQVRSRWRWTTRTAAADDKDGKDDKDAKDAKDDKCEKDGKDGDESEEGGEGLSGGEPEPIIMKRFTKMMFVKYTMEQLEIGVEEAMDMWILALANPELQKDLEVNRWGSNCLVLYMEERIVRQ